MKYNPINNCYKASNVLFNCNSCEAYSYDWWCFVKKVGEKVVFNSYYYSSTTIKHQYKVRALLDSLGINIDLEIECPAGLQANDVVGSVKEHYSKKINKLTEAMDKPRSHARKNEERAAEIQELAEISAKFVKLVESNEN